MTVLYFGSDFDKDDLAWKVAYALNGRKCFDVHEIKSGDVIVDVVKGVENVRVVSVSELQEKGFLSSHDFDLNTYLKIMEQLQDVKIMIIGIPYGYDEKKAVEEVRELLNVE